jgi:hypothetical protein
MDRHPCPPWKVPADPTLNDICLVFKLPHVLAVLVKCLALFRGMALDGLLKGPATFFNLFCMFQQAFER